MQRAKTKLASVEFVLFDEISMISAVNFNALDCMLRTAKDVNLPMGGVHIVGNLQDYLFQIFVITPNLIYIFTIQLVVISCRYGYLKDLYTYT